MSDQRTVIAPPDWSDACGTESAETIRSTDCTVAVAVRTSAVVSPLAPFPFWSMALPAASLTSGPTESV